MADDQLHGDAFDLRRNEHALPDAACSYGIHQRRHRDPGNPLHVHPDRRQRRRDNRRPDEVVEAGDADVSGNVDARLLQLRQRPQRLQVGEGRESGETLPDFFGEAERAAAAVLLMAISAVLIIVLERFVGFDRLLGQGLFRS